MRRLIMTGLLATLLLSAAPLQAAEILTARGPVSVADQPEILAVYDVAAIETLLALGVAPDGVPSKLYIPELSEALADATPVGTLFEPDLEALAALGPALIVAGGRSSTQVEALSQVAPTIDMTIGADLVPEARARLAAYGALFGKEAEAATLDAALAAKLEEARQAAVGQGTALIVLTNGPKVSAYGLGSRFGWIHEALDLPEARPALDPATHGDAISFEFIAEVNPDWLIVIDRGAAVGEEGSAAAATLDTPLVTGTTAWRQGQVIYLDPAQVYIAGGGYASMMQTLDRLISGFRG